MSDSSLPPAPEGYKSWPEYCFKNPDASSCENIPGFYLYDISLAANATFVALFSLSLIGFVTTYVVTRRGAIFTSAFVAGIILEILGYAGRLMNVKNRWDENGFLMQICCLTIAPAFLAGGIYLCLRRIVYVFGPENSRIKPETYTRFFIPCDVISLVLQAAGGAIASINSHNDKSTKVGDDIMIAGLSFQVVVLLIFMTVSIDFGLNVMRRRRQLGEAALDQSTEMRDLRRSFGFRGLLVSLSLATICIFWRSVFRVAELSRGWEGPLMARQDLLIGFEGVMIIVACLALNIFHPSVFFGKMMEGKGSSLSAKNSDEKNAREFTSGSDTNA